MQRVTDKTKHQLGARWCQIVVTGVLVLFLSDESLAGGGSVDEHGERTSRISDDSIPSVDSSRVPPRPDRLEFGDPFIGTGAITPGVELPGGAVLQPSLLIFGTYRTAIQAFDNGETTFSEWTNRLDLFGNLQLTGTERFLVGIQPLHRRDQRRFTGYHFDPARDPAGRGDEGWVDGSNARITTAFFEGDFGEMFPELDPEDRRSLDYGFAVGRQPLFFQEGLLINDTVDAIGIIRNNVLPEGGSNLQVTAIYGWGEIGRGDGLANFTDDDLQLFGVFMAADYPIHSVNLDFVYEHDSDGPDSVYWGASTTQRIGHFNTAFHLLGSEVLDDGVESFGLGSGVVLFSEVSWVQPWSDDNVYFNCYWGIDQFTSAARDPTVGGPLGRIGLLWASQGLGRFVPAINNSAQDSVGFALGYQLFLDEDFRRQVVFEIGGKQGTLADGDGTFAAGTRFQQALGQHTVLQIDVFGSVMESRDAGWGTRMELQYSF